MNLSTSWMGWGPLALGRPPPPTRQLSGSRSWPRKTRAAQLQAGPKGAASPRPSFPGCQENWGDFTSSRTSKINLHDKFLCKQMSGLFFLL